VTLQIKRKLDEEKLKYALTDVPYFWLEKCNKFDLTAVPYFWLANHNDWSRWFAISSLPPICSPSLSCMGGVEGEK
jgi:hypothetical protein